MALFHITIEKVIVKYDDVLLKEILDKLNELTNEGKKQEIIDKLNKAISDIQSTI